MDGGISENAADFSPLPDLAQLMFGTSFGCTSRQMKKNFDVCAKFIYFFAKNS